MVDSSGVGIWDDLLGRLVTLHQPHLFEGEPVCHGCDRERGALGEHDGDPTRPCRTYTIIAAAVLGQPDVEGLLTTMDRQSVAGPGATQPVNVSCGRAERALDGLEGSCGEPGTSAAP